VEGTAEDVTDCCEPGCSAEVLCPVHQALADLRAQVEADRADLNAKIERAFLKWPIDHEQVDAWASERVALNRALARFDAAMKEEVSNG
jgi:hypothetical protein